MAWLTVLCKLIDYSVNFETALDYIRSQYTQLIHLNINTDVIPDLYKE